MIEKIFWVDPHGGEGYYGKGLKSLNIFNGGGPLWTVAIVKAEVAMTVTNGFHLLLLLDD